MKFALSLLVVAMSASAFANQPPASTVNCAAKTNANHNEKTKQQSTQDRLALLDPQQVNKNGTQSPGSKTSK